MIKTCASTLEEKKRFDGEGQLLARGVGGLPGAERRAPGLLVSPPEKRANPLRRHGQKRDLQRKRPLETCRVAARLGDPLTSVPAGNASTTRASTPPASTSNLKVAKSRDDLRNAPYAESGEKATRWTVSTASAASPVPTGGAPKSTAPKRSSPAAIASRRSAPATLSGRLLGKARPNFSETGSRFCPIHCVTRDAGPLFS